jgi:hypothetical protein
LSEIWPGLSFLRSAVVSADGGAATRGIRPERLRVLRDNPTVKFEMAGKVVERRYFGEITDLIVEIPGAGKAAAGDRNQGFRRRRHSDRHLDPPRL